MSSECVPAIIVSSAGGGALLRVAHSVRSASQGPTPGVWLTEIVAPRSSLRYLFFSPKNGVHFKQKKYLREKVALFVIDYEMDFDNPDLPAQLETLRDTIQRYYQQYTGKTQEVVWVIAHPVTRLD